MNKRLFVCFLFVFMSLILVGCSKDSLGSIKFNVSSNSDNLFMEAEEFYASESKQFNNKTLEVPAEMKVIAVENNNKILTVVNEPGIYSLDGYDSSKVKYYYIKSENIGEVTFNGKISLDKSYFYSGKIIVNDYDPSIIMKNVDFKNTNFKNYFNKFLKEDLEKNFNSSISELVNEKNISINEISSDDLAKKLDKLIDFEYKKGVSIEIIFDSIK